MEATSSLVSSAHASTFTAGVTRFTQPADKRLAPSKMLSREDLFIDSETESDEGIIVTVPGRKKMRCSNFCLNCSAALRISNGLKTPEGLLRQGFGLTDFRLFFVGTA